MPGRSVALRTRPEGSDKGEDTPRQSIRLARSVWRASLGVDLEATPFSPAFGNMNSPSLQEGRGYSLGSPVLRRR